MKQRVTGILAGFLALMLALTVLSRAADSVTVARVETEKTAQGKITHTVSGTGKVVQNREQAVSTLSGQTVKTIYVEEGEKVEEGDLLFEVDLTSLKEQILYKKQEMEKADTAVSRAATELANAKKKLKTLESASSESSTGTDAVEEVLKEACEQKQEEYDEAVKYRDELLEAIDAAVEKAIEDAQKGDDTASLFANAREAHMAAEDEGTAGTAADTKNADNAGTEELFAGAVSVQAETEAPADSIDAASVQAAETESAAGITETEAAVWETEAAQTTETAAQKETADGTQQAESAQTEQAQTGTESKTTDSSEEDEYVLDNSASDDTADAWLIEQRVRKQNQSLLDDAEKKITEKETEVQEAKEALEEYQQEQASGTQTSVDEMKEQLEEEIRTKQEAYEDAVTSANDSLRSAARAVEDANAPEGRIVRARLMRLPGSRRNWNWKNWRSCWKQKAK